MKPLRLLLIGLLGLVLLMVIAVALAFTPGVQTWAARKFAPAGPELTVDIGRVNAGLSQSRLENVRVVQPGLVLTLPLVEIDVGVLDAAGGKVEIKRLVAKGWILDLSSPAAVSPTAPGKTPEAAADEAFDGLFKLLELPFDLMVDGVDLIGEVLLPAGNAQVALSGGGVAAGQDGRFTLTTNLKTTDGSALVVNGVLATRMNTPRTFERIEFTANATATGPQVPKGAALDFAASAIREGQSENYLLTLRSGQRHLFNATMTLPQGDAPLAGSWKLDATHADAAPFTLGMALPEFAAKGQGTFEADRAFSQIKTAGTLDATADKLAALQPEFAALGRLAFSAAFNVATQGDIVRLNTFDARVAGAKPVANVTALQAVEFNTATGELTAADPAAELLRITLDGVPLAWAAPFLGDLVLTGDDVRGAFTASARDNGFTLRPAAPITLGNLSVTQAGELLLQALNVTLSAQADYTPKGWTADVTDLSARSGGATLVTLTAKAAQLAGEKQPLTASGKFEANIPALLGQPVAGGGASLQQGVARGDFTAAIADTQQANVTVQLADLVAADASPLPSVALQASINVDAAGRIDAKIPMIVSQRKRRSDIRLDAVLTPSGKATHIVGSLTGDTVHLSDLMALSAVSPTAPEAEAPQTPPAKKPGEKPAPTEPLWAGVTGEIKIDFKRLIYEKDIETSLRGVVKITPDTLRLETMKGALKTGGTLDAKGGLMFEAKKKQPYALKADLALVGVEPAPIFRALAPKEQPPVEGKFDITTQLSGRAIAPSAFDENVIGDIHLSGKGGTFRALSTNASNIVGAASGVAGMVGILAGGSTAKYAERTRAMADITQQLGAIKFDELNLVIARDKKKNMDIKDLTLLSPLIHLKGSGQIKNAPDKPLMQRPLLLNLQLGAKDKFAADLRTLKLLSDKPDKLGYAAMSEVLTLDGSLQSIGTKQVETVFRNALLR